MDGWSLILTSNTHLNTFLLGVVWILFLPTYIESENRHNMRNDFSKKNMWSFGHMTVVLGKIWRIATLSFNTVHSILSNEFVSNVAQHWTKCSLETKCKGKNALAQLQYVSSSLIYTFCKPYCVFFDWLHVFFVTCMFLSNQSSCLMITSNTKISLQHYSKFYL